MMKQLAIYGCMMILAASLTGCQTRGTAKRVSISGANGEKVNLPSGFEKGYYRYHDKNGLTVLLVDGPVENPTQAVTIKMFWKPRAARTPISREATNCSIRYVIFAGDQVGVYGGGGFLYPNTKLGKEALVASVWNGNMQLTANTPSFADRLVQAAIEGRFVTRRDDALVEVALRNINIMIRDRLGYPVMVMAD